MFRETTGSELQKSGVRCGSVALLLVMIANAHRGPVAPVARVILVVSV